MECNDDEVRCRCMDSVNRQTNFSFLLKDFEKTFDMYIYSHSDRSEAIKMYVTFCTVPFLLFSLLGLASEIDLKFKTLPEVIDQFPSFIFLIFSIFGFVGIVPFYRFISAHSNAYKMIRYMNNYRFFYYQLIQDELDERGWRSAIEKDPRHPIYSIKSLHWTLGFALAMFFVNTAYVCGGLYLWDGNGSTIIIILSLIIIVPVHVAIVVSELTVKDVDRLNEMDLPFEEVLKKINSKVELKNDQPKER